MPNKLTKNSNGISSCRPICLAALEAQKMELAILRKPGPSLARQQSDDDTGDNQRERSHAIEEGHPTAVSLAICREQSPDILIRSLPVACGHKQKPAVRRRRSDQRVVATFHAGCKHER